MDKRHTMPITITLKPNTPARVLRLLKPYIMHDSGVVDITRTDWYRQDGMSAGDYLRELRHALSMSQSELGKTVGATIQRVSDWEYGRRGISRAIAKRLAGVFGVSPAVFL